MTSPVQLENPYAGQGSVLLDIGGDVGALVVTMPAAMEGIEVEIRPEGAEPGHAPPQDHGHGHGHEHEHESGSHHPHVAVVSRPVGNDRVPSLVFPELVAGRYELYEKLTRDIHLSVTIRGGEVATAAW